MGCQTPTSGDRSRTYWTPTMEQFFIDLLLDHMHRGNRSGHTFNKQAWADMISAFNGKFRTQYDKDVLKSRYTSLWKQFNDVKNLLDQSGFSWDDTLQMVVADDFVWDTYVKAHPNARFYRNKAVMNFNDLYLIYAYTTADGRYSRSSHDIDFDDDFQGMNFGDGTGSLTLASNEHPKTDWTLAMDQYFIKLMLDQVEKGNKINRTFKKRAWTDMLTLFNAKFCSQLCKRDLRHRFKKLWRYYSDIRFLLEQDGFSWDKKKQMLTADDYTWDNFIKEYPRARAYGKKTLLNYEDLILIYGVSITNGVCDYLHQDRDLEDDFLQTNGEEKDVQIPSVSERVLTSWTPSMDYYFIDLLLDQVLRGNRIGHAFITQAWIEMVTLFNKKFGSHHDKDDLKNRYRHMRMRYNDTKLLLEQGGFSWDETKEMVLAEDHVWDNLTKEYQSYKNKTMPSFHKLCVIYGPECSNNRYSHLDPNIDLGGAVPATTIEGENPQRHANNGNSRTDWTPSMDRYLIDLLLAQVHKRKRIDHSFHRQAWVDMTTSFNERFETQHDKNVLSSRYENLRMLYHDMKNILDHNDFSWDEMKQMVTAYDDVWDAYIKEQPDAKSFRTEKKPNYNDLCLIYGYSTSDGGCKQFDQDLDFNHNGSGFQALNYGSGLMTDWTPSMDRYFIDLMLEGVHKGSMINCKFKKQAWADMVVKFNKQFGPQHDRGVLKIRFKNLRKCFWDMKILLDQIGFVWDEVLQMVTAADYLWDSFIKEYPDAETYRNRPLPNYNDLFLIYGNAIADGSNNRSSQCIDVDDYDLELSNCEENDQSPACSGAPDACFNLEMGDDNYAPELEMDGIFGNLEASAWDIGNFSQNKKRQFVSPSTLTFSRKVRKTNMEGMLSEMEGAVATLGSDEEDKNYSSIESIVDALQTIPDMDDELFLDACKLLEDENKAKIFVTLDVTWRKKWLLKKLRA